MEIMQNYWGQREIINKIKMLNKRGTDTIHATIPTKNWKYPSTTILKYVNILAKVNKSPYGCLPNIRPHNTYSITIHICTVTLLNISN